MAVPGEWVDSLCPKDLFHYFGLLHRIRTEHLRELLHVQVSAAAVVADGGKAFKELDASLGEAGKPPKPQKPKPARPQPKNQGPVTF